MVFKIILFSMEIFLRFAIWRSAGFRAHLKGKNLKVQLCTADRKVGRMFVFNDGKITSRAGVHDEAQSFLIFKTAKIGARLLLPPIDQLEQIEAMKNFLFHPEGPDEDTVWFA